MRKIRITEINFRNIIKKMKKVTDKYRVNYTYISKSKNGETINKFPGIQIVKHHTLVKTKNHGYQPKVYHKLISNDIFADIEVHHTRTIFEKKCSNPTAEYNTFEKTDIEFYLKYLPLIFIGIGPDSVLILHDGDLIRFLPFNLGFILYTKDRFNVFYCSSFEYRMIKNPFKKIDYSTEIKKREDEELKLNLIYESEASNIIDSIIDSNEEDEEEEDYYV